VELHRNRAPKGVLKSVSAETVRQFLLHHRLKPWWQKMWLSSKVARHAAFAVQVKGFARHYGYTYAIIKVR
jgi:hypothetical protein